jgi:hypothetical protein
METNADKYAPLLSVSLFNDIREGSHIKEPVKVLNC